MAHLQFANKVLADVKQDVERGLYYPAKHLNWDDAILCIISDASFAAETKSAGRAKLRHAVGTSPSPPCTLELTSLGYHVVALCSLLELPLILLQLFLVRAIVQTRDK